MEEILVNKDKDIRMLKNHHLYKLETNGNLSHLVILCKIKNIYIKGDFIDIADMIINDSEYLDETFSILEKRLRSNIVDGFEMSLGDFFQEYKKEIKLLNDFYHTEYKQLNFLEIYQLASLLREYQMIPIDDLLTLISKEKKILRKKFIDF